MRSVKDRLSGRRFYYADYLDVTHEKTGLKTVAHWHKNRNSVVPLHPSRLPPDKSSMPMTVWPALSRWEQTWDPRNPAQPVTIDTGNVQSSLRTA